MSEEDNTSLSMREKVINALYSGKLTARNALGDKVPEEYKDPLIGIASSVILAAGAYGVYKMMSNKRVKSTFSKIKNRFSRSFGSKKSRKHRKSRKHKKTRRSRH